MTGPSMLSLCVVVDADYYTDFRFPLGSLFSQLWRRREEQSLKLALGQPWVWSVSDFIFSLGIWGRVASPLPHRLIFPLETKSSGKMRQCAISVLIIHVELARERRWSRNLEPNFCPGRDLNPEPHGWRSSTLTTGPPRNPTMNRS